MKNRENINIKGQKNTGLKLAANGVLMIINGFLLALIVCLFLFQPGQGKHLKETIHDFPDNSKQYYDEDETYRQDNDNIDTYKASGRPDVSHK